METASLPAGARSLYDDGATYTSVFTTTFGAGRIGYLGFDWFETPTPRDWEQVLGSVLADVAEPVDLQCYQAKDLKNPKFEKQLGVSVTDQFGTSLIEVKKPFMVCAPTDTDVETHLCCYKSKGAQLSSAVEVETEDTFGTLQLQLKKAKMYCKPCTKSVLP